MRTVNLIHLASAAKTSSRDEINLEEFQLARRVLEGNNDQVKSSDVTAFCAFIQDCLRHRIQSAQLSGFYSFYHLPNISREFDLIKLGNRCAINIELKSQTTDVQKMKDQLVANRYYLTSVGNKATESFVYVADGHLYQLIGEKLNECDWDHLASALTHTGPLIETPLEILFHPSRYLISPINDKERFLNDEFFLTEHQAQIKKTVLDYFFEGENAGFVVKGGPGTGKTLLLYDIAKTMAIMAGNQPSCIVHCGTKCSIHDRFNEGQKLIRLIPAKDVTATNLCQFCFIGVDEGHRVHEDTLKIILDQINQTDIPYFIAADENQILSYKEANRNILRILSTIIPDDRFFKLKNNMRSNDSICSFVAAFFNNSKQVVKETGDVIPVYASNSQEAIVFLKSFISEGYQSISLSPSMYVSSELNEYDISGTISAHQSIGQEFENVVVVVPNILHLENGQLKDRIKHPNPDYISSKLLFEGMTRARSKLAIIFEGCPGLYHRALSLLDGRTFTS